MTDKEILDMIEERGIQIWPQRKSKHGPIQTWYVQNVLPFIQTFGPTVRVAMTNLKKILDETHP